MIGSLSSSRTDRCYNLEETQQQYRCGMAFVSVIYAVGFIFDFFSLYLSIPNGCWSVRGYF
jgi:hypothetical protein